jgi:peptidoglycan/xylan/chitin deacetylase (PgdA/CDA1 family)
MTGGRAVALAAGASLVVQWAPALAAVQPRAARALGIPATLASRRGVLLSFDDGPHPEGTPAMLAELADAGASAVFFVSGEQVSRYPKLAAEIAAAGHELGVHGYRHQTRRQWSRRLCTDDTRRAVDTVASVTGTRPRLYRPPHGVFSVTGLRLIRRVGLRPLLWSRWGRDWERGATAATITNHVARLVAGDVVLLHDGDHYGAHESWRATAAALPRVLERIAGAGLEPAAVARGRASERLVLTV